MHSKRTILRFGPRNMAHLACFGARLYSGPLVKSYTPLTTPFSLWWAQNVPLTAKYASALITTAVAATHVHPNTIVTLGPPTLALSYFIYRRFEHKRYRDLLRLVQTLQNDDSLAENAVCIKHYDEADPANVMAGIENEFDSFRSQILPVIRSKFVDHVMEYEQSGSESAVVKSVLDENKQMLVYVEEDPETFVTLKAESAEEGFFPKFITFSVPYFTSRNIKTRKRLGVLQISMLELKSEEDELDKKYRLAIQAWPHGMFSKSERIC